MQTRKAGIPRSTCTLYGKQTRYRDPPEDVVRKLFGKCNCCSMENIRVKVTKSSKANICGAYFTAGQDIGGDRNKRCGSIVTSVIAGQSMYGKVRAFFSSVCPHNQGVYAHIEWMRVPDYPSGTPLVVRLRDNAAECTAPTVISILDIDPSRVICERSEVENSYYMCRIEGLDTIKQ